MLALHQGATQGNSYRDTMKLDSRFTNSNFKNPKLLEIKNISKEGKTSSMRHFLTSQSCESGFFMYYKYYLVIFMKIWNFSSLISKCSSLLKTFALKEQTRNKSEFQQNITSSKYRDLRETFLYLLHLLSRWKTQSLYGPCFLNFKKTGFRKNVFLSRRSTSTLQAEVSVMFWYFPVWF